jgi:hypothetical protein
MHAAAADNKINTRKGMLRAPFGFAFSLRRAAANFKICLARAWLNRRDGGGMIRPFELRAGIE